jgi:hypothetical protein
VSHGLGGIVVKDVSGLETPTPPPGSRGAWAFAKLDVKLTWFYPLKALHTAYQESKEDPIRKPQVAAIKSATMGIVFLGTPHRGSNKAKWASIATNFAAAVLKDHNDKVIEALSRGAETLERVQTGFSRILISLPVYSFFEDHQYEKIGKVRSETHKMGAFINWSFTHRS